ncbi:MAG TPA: hypothetical protein VMH86_15515 [Rhizomicrobium sp.]|nr:hypothetical protein [Rhizomicrobium sp.]
MSGGWSPRLVAGALAIGATLAVFWIWMIFGSRLMQAMNVPWADSSRPAAPANNGEITVDVLPPPKPCPPKDASCKPR